MQPEKEMPQNNFELEKFLPYILNVAAERTTASISNQYQNKYNLRRPEWRMLLHLARLKPNEYHTVSQLVRLTMIEKSVVSRTAKKLIALGFVERIDTPHDSRSFGLSLSRKGQRLVNRLTPIAMKHQHELMKLFSKEEAHYLYTALSKLREL